MFGENDEVIFKEGHHKQYVGYFAQDKNVNFSTQNTTGFFPCM